MSEQVEFLLENPDLVAIQLAALLKIQAVQPRRVAWFREQGIVFDDAPRVDGDRWQNIAFQIYTDLCEVEALARGALQT